MLDLGRIANATLGGLKSISLIADAVIGDVFSDVDFKVIRERARSVEQNDKRDRLREVVRNVASLTALAGTPDEDGEITKLREMLERRTAALAQTRGVLFHALYSSVQQVYTAN